jgi:hypothetical protein
VFWVACKADLVNKLGKGDRIAIIAADISGNTIVTEKR